MAHVSRTARKISSAGHIHRSLSVGKDGERRFYDSCKAKGLDIKKTSAKEDMHHHADFLVKGNYFDVKGLKNTHKQGQLLLEVKNVKGELGWCNNQNKPDFIAFDFGSFFFCANNSDLYSLIMKKCQLNDQVKKIGDALYKGYTRRGREDLMTIVSLEDAMIGCEYWILPYEEHRAPMELL